MNRKTLFNILKVLVSLGLLYFIFRSLDMQALLTVVRQANLWWLLAGLAMVLLGVVIRAVRWQILLDAIGVRVSIGELTSIYFIGFLFNNLLPSGLGGDAIRVIELNRHSERGADAVTSVLVDRFVGLSALQLIALVALLADWGAVPLSVAYFTVAIFIVGMVGGFLLINRPLYQALQNRFRLFRLATSIKWIGNLFESFQRYPLPALGKSYLVSLVFNITLILTNLFIGQGLGAQASLVHYAVFVPITSIVLLLPISFAGLGVRETAYSQLFGQVGVPAEVAVSMSLLYYVFGNIVTGVIGGVIYLSRSARDLVSEKSNINS
ncbi:MAG: hypothetical protein FOGNACKC_05283 [Anaerolineae bacterium]|nr:hypothetical protein [Anaerolineae bacterium]